MSAPFKLKNGSLALLAEVPGGLYNAAHLKKIAALADQHSIIIKATEDQRLALFVVPDEAEVVTRDLASTGLTLRDYQSGVHQPVSCIGALCPESKQDALKASLEITEALAGLATDCALKIGINGCANCCVPCHTLDIAVTGGDDGYRIAIGGKQSLVPELGAFAAEGIPADEIVEKVRVVVETYKECAQPGEPLAHVIERCGMIPFIKVLAPYSGDAGGGSDEFSPEGSLSKDGPVTDTHAEAAVADTGDDVFKTGASSGDGKEESLAVNAIEVAEAAHDEDVTEQAIFASMDEEGSVPQVADANAAEREAFIETLRDPDGVSENSSEEGGQVHGNVTPISDATHPAAERMLNGQASTMTIVGMDVSKDGKFALLFSNGAALAVDPGIIPFGGSRTVRFAGKELLIRADSQGFNIEIDGLDFHLPLEAA